MPNGNKTAPARVFQHHNAAQRPCRQRPETLGNRNLRVTVQPQPRPSRLNIRLDHKMPCGIGERQQPVLGEAIRHQRATQNLPGDHHLPAFGSRGAHTQRAGRKLHRKRADARAAGVKLAAHPHHPRRPRIEPGGDDGPVRRTPPAHRHPIAGFQSSCTRNAPGEPHNLARDHRILARRRHRTDRPDHLMTHRDGLGLQRLPVTDRRNHRDLAHAQRRRRLPDAVNLHRDIRRIGHFQAVHTHAGKAGNGADNTRPIHSGAANPTFGNIQLAGPHPGPADTPVRLLGRAL
jgi:hypothetical protein